MLGIIIPAYNRLENLKLTLASLLAQKCPTSFEIVLADDGSTDGLVDWLWSNFSDPFEGEMWLRRRHDSLPDVKIRYVYGGPNKGFRGARIRNLGAFNAGNLVDRFVFLDDIILHEDAIASYYLAATAQPNAVIVGRYIYLPKIDVKEHASLIWSSATYDEVMLKVNTFGLKVEQPADALQYGLDLGRRKDEDYTDDLSCVKKNCGLAALSGNISYPKELFYAIGGFDELIVGHGGEDAELGLSADEKNADWLFYKPILGYHIWHPRNQAKNAEEVQVNIAYIDKKHGVGRYANAPKNTDSRDFSSSLHYHKSVGAVVWKTLEDPTVFAVRTDLHSRIGVTSPDWLKKLEFDSRDVQTVPNDVLVQNKLCGITFDF